MKRDMKNITGWEEVMSNNHSSYNIWFEDEKKFLIENIPKESTILEIGCGNGRTLNDLKEISKDITGIDHDKKAIQDAKINLKGNPNIKLLVADGKNIPFNDGTFDIVLCMTTFANFYNDKFKILDEMKRVLKNLGIIIISVYSEDALEERLKAYNKAGLKIKEIRKNGTVVFDDLGFDGYSEQFSRKDLEDIFSRVGLKILKIEKSTIAYICKLSK